MKPLLRPTADTASEMAKNGRLQSQNDSSRKQIPAPMLP
jgi:hypothetical protein